MYLIKHNKSGFLHDGLSDKGGGTGWVAQAITGAAMIASAILNRKGDRGGNIRRQKRQALSQVGFRWDHTKGADPADYDNIDGWPDVSLDNIGQAYTQYGDIVPQLHNQGVFNKANTQSYQQIQKIIQQYGGGSTQSNLFNLGTGGGNQAGIDYNLLTYGMIAIAGVAVLATVLKQGSGTKKRK